MTHPRIKIARNFTGLLVVLGHLVQPSRRCKELKSYWTESWTEGSTEIWSGLRRTKGAKPRGG